MLSHEYKEISPELLERAHKVAYSIENMEAHDAAGRNTEYMGSHRVGDIVYDYYQDSTGAWWYKNRGVLNGRIVSMEVYIFGRDIEKERKRKWDRNT